jgi:ABC-2 type transport system ATP-binding protein
MDYAINISNLCKSYAKSRKMAHAHIALNNMNLQIKKGSFFGLLGPNGAGKSTIINIIAGLVVKDSGTVEINGLNLDKQSQEIKFKIGIVPQELIIDPFFNVYETLEFYAGYYGITPKNRRTKSIIDALGLGDKIKTAPRALSGGMRRRLLVAKALVHNPEILILDEPTAGVDIDLRNQLWDYVKSLNINQKTTVVLTTHYLEEAEKLCDEIAIINQGKLLIQKSSAELMKTLNRKQIIITSATDISTSVEKIKSDLCGAENFNLQDEIEVKVNKEELIIDFNPKNISITAIIDKVKNIVTIDDLSTKQPDLQTIFQHLIKNNICQI